MLRKSRDAVEKLLRNRGFTSPESRRNMADQILLTAASCILGVLAIPMTDGHLAFGLGTLIATVDLWQISRCAHCSVGKKFSGRLALIGFGAYLFRFAGTGVVLYLLLVKAAMPLIPLVAGLSSLVVWLSFMRFAHNAGQS